MSATPATTAAPATATAPATGPATDTPPDTAPDNAVTRSTGGLVIDSLGTTPAPAPAVPGAVTGGSVTLLADAPPEHLDPQQCYIGTTLGVTSALVHRTLTGYVEDPEGGPLTLVGDLATTAGETSDGGRTWRFTLRAGLRYEDGTPVTAQDVAHGIARSFSAMGDHGPQLLQRVLCPDGSYTGPYADGAPAPGVSTPDERTVVFTLSEPHPELPFLAALSTTTPVPPSRDTREGYERDWLATGPYRRARNQPDGSLVLERNPWWDPASDPIRHQYVDEVRWEFGVDRPTQTQRLTHPADGDETAIATADIAAEDIAAVLALPGVPGRVLAGTTSYVQYLYLNTRRLPELAVRQALNWAFDRGRYVEAAGGSAAVSPATTILAPGLPGHVAYDAYPGGPHGDPARARELLAGTTRRALTYAYPDIAPLRPLAPVVRDALARAGFEVELCPVDKVGYYDRVCHGDGEFDLVWGVWGPDYPDAAGVMDVLFRGDLVAATGTMNLSRLDVPDVTQRLIDLAKEPDRGTAAAGYAELDRLLMTEHAPVIPVFYKRQLSLLGPAVGGLFLSSMYSFPNLTRMHVAREVAGRQPGAVEPSR